MWHLGTYFSGKTMPDHQDTSVILSGWELALGTLPKTCLSPD